MKYYKRSLQCNFNSLQKLTCGYMLLIPLVLLSPTMAIADVTQSEAISIVTEHYNHNGKVVSAKIVNINGRRYYRVVFSSAQGWQQMHLIDFQTGAIDGF